jgi:hypothetical protein
LVFFPLACTLLTQAEDERKSHKKCVVLVEIDEYVAILVWWCSLRQHLLVEMSHLWWNKFKIYGVSLYTCGYNQTCITYYANYTLDLDYISLFLQLRYLLSKLWLSLTHPVNFPCGENRRTRRKPAIFSIALANSFQMRGQREKSENRIRGLTCRWKALGLTTASPKPGPRRSVFQSDTPVSLFKFF